MADQSLGTMNQTGSGSTHGFEKAAGTAKGVADQAKGVAGKLVLALTDRHQLGLEAPQVAIRADPQP